MSNDAISWECPLCGHRHSWRWERGNAIPGPIIMTCDACGGDTKTELVRIGRLVWAALWGGR